MKQKVNFQIIRSIPFLTLILAGLLMTGCKSSKYINEVKTNGERDIYFSNYKLHYFGDYRFTNKIRSLYPPYDGSALNKILRNTKVLGMGTTTIEPYFSTFIVKNRKDTWNSVEEIKTELKNRGAMNVNVVRMTEVDELNDYTFIATYKVKSKRYDINLYVSELIIVGEINLRVLIWTYNNQFNLVGESRKIFTTLERVYDILEE